MSKEIEVNGWIIVYTIFGYTIYHAAEGWTAQVADTIKDAIRWAESHDPNED